MKYNNKLNPCARISVVRSLAVLRRVLATPLCLGACALVVSMLQIACSPSSAVTPIPEESRVASPSGTLGAGDVIRVSFPGAPEMNLVQKVQANGKVSLPMLGDVTAGGRKVGSFQSQLESMYSSHLTDPKVIVSLEAPASSVYVSGEVRNPGKIALDRPMTALEAIMESGGFSKYANPKQVYVVRNVDGKHKRYVINVRDSLTNAETDVFYLKPFDVVYVKESNW